MNKKEFEELIERRMKHLRRFRLNCTEQYSWLEKVLKQIKKK